jgi:hypothetical protein
LKPGAGNPPEAVVPVTQGTGAESTTLVHPSAPTALAPETWRDRYQIGVALQQQGQADAAAAALSGLLRDHECPPLLHQEVLHRLGNLCMNSFGDAVAARVLLQRLSGVPGHDLKVDLATIVADQYLGEGDASALSGRLTSLARRYLPQAKLHDTVDGKVRGAGVQRRGGARPRIALISNQWCSSPVAFLTLGALCEMARKAHLVFFDRGGKSDWARRAFQALAHAWHDVREADADAIDAAIRAAEADALVDLSGWTDPVALQAVARRPVRRQLKWVGGQAATTGAHCFDGFIADAQQVPHGCEALYTEPVLRATSGYITYTPPPYWKPGSAIDAPPPPSMSSANPGVYAIAANPVKISLHTTSFLRTLRPRRLLLIDNRWRHQQTRRAAAARLGNLLDVAEFVTPATHPEYLDTLASAPATFVDTSPYSMGLAAVELRLLGKPVVQPPRPALRSISESHCAGHLSAPGFGHHAQLAGELLHWCRQPA